MTILAMKDSLKYALKVAAITSLVPFQALTAEAGKPLEFGGSLRSIIVGMDNDGFEPLEGFSQSILRLTGVGNPSPWFSYEIHAIQSYEFSTRVENSGTSVLDLGPRESRYHAVNGVNNWLSGGGTSASFWVDRLNVKLKFRRADLTIGRQALTFGKAYFWNPLDLFHAFDPRQFDRDYKPGVDALRVDIPTGDFSGVTLVGALGREIDLLGGFLGGDDRWGASWYGSALMGRFYATTRGWDIAIQGGKVYGGYQIGGGTVGELGPVEMRGEAAYLIAEESPALPFGLSGDLIEDHLTAVMGLGHRFRNTLTLEGEYLYNGAGDPDDLDAAFVRFGSGGSFHLGRHLVGLLGSYEILPILTGQLGSLISFSDGSGQVQPGLKYSAADEVDLLAGALINFGDRPMKTAISGQGLQSEFGTFPDIYYLEFKVYF